MTRQDRYRKRKPWVRFVEWARRRCNDTREKEFRNYGAKGITCQLTASDVEKLWIRDNAAKLKKPSLDRIDASKSYTVENCRFIEFYENIRRPHVPDLEKVPDWVTEN